MCAHVRAKAQIGRFFLGHMLMPACINNDDLSTAAATPDTASRIMESYLHMIPLFQYQPHVACCELRKIGDIKRKSKQNLWIFYVQSSFNKTCNI